MNITDITIVKRQHHADDISLTTDLPGTCTDEPFLRLHCKIALLPYWGNTVSLDYIKEHFPGIPISIINTIEGTNTEIDAEGNAQERSIPRSSKMTYSWQ